jgi:integral membrane sensor domain MASE1
VPSLFFRAIAYVVAPFPLTVVFVATTPPHTLSRPIIDWLLYHLIALLVFLPTLLLTRYLARRFSLSSRGQVAALMAASSVILTSIVAIAVSLMTKTPYTWPDELRDAAVSALGAVGSLYVFWAVMGLGPRAAIGTAPNQRLERP